MSNLFHRLGRRGLLAIGAVVVILLVGIGITTIKAPKSAPPSHPAVPLAITAISPASGTSAVPFAAPIHISFSAPLAPHWTAPVLSPSIAGHWTQRGAKSLVFMPTGHYIPNETIHVSIPAGSNGIGSTDGTTLDAAFNATFTVANASTLRLQQLLAELGYLPVAFVPNAVESSASPTTTPDTITTPDTSASSGTSGATGAPLVLANSEAELASEPSVSSAISLNAQSGLLTWRFANVPSQLAALWAPGAFDTVTQGAVMAFESDAGLKVDGEPGADVWSKLLDAVASRQLDSQPYDYLIATETEPESLYVWREGQVIFSTRTNSGVAGATTPLGTWPVYLRYTSATMKGTNPDGTHYSDPGVPWISYFHNSDAVHGFIRPSYGFPQSVGCLEIPVANAATVYPLDPYGTLVTVTTGNLASELSTPIPPPYVTSAPTSTTTTSTTPGSTTSTSPPTTTTTP